MMKTARVRHRFCGATVVGGVAEVNDVPLNISLEMLTLTRLLKSRCTKNRTGTNMLSKIER